MFMGSLILYFIWLDWAHWRAGWVVYFLIYVWEMRVSGFDNLSSVEIAVQRLSDISESGKSEEAKGEHPKLTI